jgi:hypothetical protein
MPTADTTNHNLSREERVRLRALELYKRRGDRPGTPVDDWLCAEQQIREQEERAIDETSEDSFPASDPPAR